MGGEKERKISKFSSKGGRGHLQEVGCLQEVPSIVNWLGNFRYFGKILAEERWSLTRGGRKWRFDCTKNKQKKMEELADKLGFSQDFLFLHCFLFLLFSSSDPLFYVGATALSQPCCKLPCFVIWREFDVQRNEFAKFLKFVMMSLPTYVCRVKAA